MRNHMKIKVVTRITRRYTNITKWSNRGRAPRSWHSCILALTDVRFEPETPTSTKKLAVEGRDTE